MAEFLQTLTGPEVLLTDLSVHIHIDFDEDYPTNQSPPKSVLHDRRRLLANRDPIVRALFTLTSVKRLYIQLVAHARFEPGVADKLRKHFKESASADVRSIVIEKGCCHPHVDPRYMLAHSGPGSCRQCGHSYEELEKGTVDWEYQDDLDMCWNMKKGWVATPS